MRVEDDASDTGGRAWLGLDDTSSEGGRVLEVDANVDPEIERDAGRVGESGSVEIESKANEVDGFLSSPSLDSREPKDSESHASVFVKMSGSSNAKRIKS